MPRNGSGTFNRLYSWEDDAANNIKIRADRMDAEMDGMATALTNSIAVDGQTPITANLPMSGFKHTGVADAAELDEYATYGQLLGDGTPLGVTLESQGGGVGATAAENDAAYNALVSSGANHIIFGPGNYDFNLGALDTIENQDIVLEGAGLNATNLVFVSGSGNGISISQTNSDQSTLVRDLAILTRETSDTAGTALSITYDSAYLAETHYRNRSPVALLRVLISGFSTTVHGWLDGATLTNVHNPVFFMCQIYGQEDTTQPSDSEDRFWGNMTSGIKCTVTSTNAPTFLYFLRCRMKCVEYAVKVEGAGEGVHLQNCAFGAVNYGVHIDRTLLGSTQKEPEVRITNSHINASTAGIYLRESQRIQILGCNFVCFGNIETGSWSGIELEDCRDIDVDSSTFNKASSRTDTATSIKLIRSSDGVLQPCQHGRVDVPVSLEDDECTRIKVYPQERWAGFSTSDTVVFNGTSSPNDNMVYQQPVENTDTSSTIPSSGIQICTTPVNDVVAGDLIKVKGYIVAEKGATGGRTVAVMQSGGTATITRTGPYRWDSFVGSGNHWTAYVEAFMTVTADGDATFFLATNSQESDSTILQSSLTVERV